MANITKDTTIGEALSKNHTECTEKSTLRRLTLEPFFPYNKGTRLVLCGYGAWH